MDAAGSVNASVSLDEVTGELEEESSKVDSLEVVSSSGDILREIKNPGDVLTRVELDLACSSEKLINLNSLVMHVATKENELEAFPLDKDPAFEGSAEKVLEFELLSGILDSEVKELDHFISTLQTEIVLARDTVASCQHLGETFKEMQAKLNDCEESLKQSQELISEIKVQSANFQRITLTYGKHEGVESFGNGYLSNLDTRIKMQTTEQQRHILRMLEKSLARELDLEKKVAESRQNEELLNLRLQEEIFFMEEEAEAAWERLFKAENLAEVLLSSSKQLLARLQILQFSLNGSTQREEDLRSKLQDHIAKLQAKDRTSKEHERTIIEPREEIKLLQEKQDTVLELQNVKNAVKGNKDLSSKIHELESVINRLKSKTSEAEKRAETAETESKLLREANMDLQTELTHSKSDSSSAFDRSEKLGKQLLEADIRLQHAVASAEATQEKQTMLCSMIKDMDNLIGDLKSKVLKAESETESAEEKCIMLSESNADLNEEVNFLRGRVECLEASLHQAEETKKATTKEIRMRTKLITDLVVDLAFERERLHKQIYSLVKYTRVLENKLAKAIKDSPVNTSNDDKESTQKTVPLNHDVSNLASTKESENDAINFSTTSSERCNASTDVSGLEDVRNIDARQLNFKYFLLPVIVLLTSAAAAFWCRYQNTQI